MTIHVAIATCSKLPEPDHDEALLIAALQAAGARVRLLPWDDGGPRARPGELVVLRSTWNYVHDVESFLAWTARTAAVARLLNPAAIVHDNVKKTYLRALELQGIATVPTEYVEAGERRRVEDITRARGWSAIVIKPVVSAGSFMTRRFDVGPNLVTTTMADAESFLAQMASERDAMVQQWMPSVETYGERSLVWIDGEITHAIRKSPRFAGGSENVSAEVPIAPDERAFAERIMTLPSFAEGRLLYARIDIVRDEDGGLRLMELELIEPSLFLKQCPRALERLTTAIMAHARDVTA